MAGTTMGRIALFALVIFTGRSVASPSDGDGPLAPIAGVAAKARPFAGPATTAAVVARTGTLAGKTVYVSAGHGWFFTEGAWRTQRGNTHDLVEDFITAEGVNQFLIPYLHAMGAHVVPIRESDLSPHAVVVDDRDAVLEGEVTELAATDPGWGPYATPFADPTLAPFAQGTARTITASPTETGRAVFPVRVAEPGTYNVYIAYAQGPERAPDAHVIVRHAGGESHVRVDQRRHGGTWVLLGRWSFAAEGAIAFANDSAEPGAAISFDAVRVGGGMAPQLRDGATTGRAAFESAARYATQMNGAPVEVYAAFPAESSNDVVSRPRFAAWDHEAGEDAIYLAWHTNAPSPARGTMTIAFGNTYPCCRGLDDFAGTAGSLALLHAVHDELIADLRAGFDPAWTNSGKVTAALGELNPAHNPEMPAILVELAFHSTAADADALRTPSFQRRSARAMAQGIARYFATRDGRPLILPPEPPVAVRVQNAGPGTLRIAWRPPATDPGAGDPPARYRVQLGETGHGFADGIEVTGESLVLEDLSPGALRFVRVTAVNDGGESLPTEVVGARVATRGTAPILVVGGYDRLEPAQLVRDLAPIVGEVDRMWIHRINDGSYAVRHGLALATAGYAFDGAMAAAIDELPLATYAAVDWLAGEQASPFPAATRAQLLALLAAGGKLLVSGSELVRAHDQGDAFLRDVLHVSLASDDAATYDVPSLTGPFAGLAAISFRDLGAGGYDARAPDALIPEAGATTVLRYPDDQAAAIAWDGGIVVGFPLELVQGEAARAAVFDAAMQSFGVPKEPLPLEPEPSTGCGCGTAGGGESWIVWGLAGLFVFRRRLNRR
ncbi:MAG: N-acetylmuramoyl-L-alanine amidase [Kofleriaceae bacterium]